MCSLACVRTINQPLVVYRHGQDASDEPEVFHVVFIAETRVWVHLQCIVVTVKGGDGGGEGERGRDREG